MKRRSQHKTTGQSLWRVPLSARSELHSHPLAEEAQACGRLTKAERPAGPMAPIVTTGVSSGKKKPFSRIILPLEAMLICSVSFHGKEDACHPCATSQTPQEHLNAPKLWDRCHSMNLASKNLPKQLSMFFYRWHQSDPFKNAAEQWCARPL